MNHFTRVVFLSESKVIPGKEITHTHTHTGYILRVTSNAVVVNNYKMFHCCVLQDDRNFFNVPLC